MSEKINLVYWSEENFGDALSPVLVEELSGLEVQLKHAYKSKVRRMLKAALSLSRSELKAILFPWQHNVLGVGSVIIAGNKHSKVWGSGFLNDAGQFKGAEILAVRGPLTADRLVKQGFPACEVYGDPAVLLPLWLKAASEKRYRIGIVPHWKECSYFLEHYQDQYKVIDLRTRDIPRVVEEITSCDYILSTSLHGLVVAHAYQIPALWIRKGDIETDGFKFADYFSSVGIEPYPAFEYSERDLTTESECLALFQAHKDKSLTKQSLPLIQKQLLQVAPFPLKRKYVDIINTLEDDV